MSKSIFDVTWLDVVPLILNGDNQVKALSAATSPELQAVSSAIAECILLARLDELDEDVVDLLAWQYHVDFYDTELTIAQKRKLVQTSIDMHRHKGTPYAVEQVVSAILDNAVVQEWFDYGGEPYYFRVVKIGGELIDADAYVRLKKAIDTVKNTRSWLEGVSLSRTINSIIYFGIALSLHRKADIYPAAFTMPDVSHVQYLGGLIHIHKKQYMKG